MKRAGTYFGIFLLGFWLYACSSSQSAPIKPVPYPRVVSLAPSLTEIVYALEKQEHLVGVTQHCNYPPSAKAKPKVGGLKNINLEVVLSLKPDLVLCTEDGNDLTQLKKLKELGLELDCFQPANLEEVLETILQIGELLSCPEKAKEIIQQLKAKQEEVEKRIKKTKPVPVLVVFQHSPLISAGPDTFANDLVKKAGGINLADDAPLPYPVYNQELVIKKSPQVIIDTAMSSDAQSRSQILKFWSHWKELPAVKNQRIYLLNPDLLTRPGPRLFAGLEQLAHLLHPEVFEESSQ